MGHKAAQLPAPSPNGGRAAGLRARVASLFAQFSQSEIARRTGFEQSSISRYGDGTRVPADFCAAVIKHFGVNPSWLMAGQGPVFLADLTTEAASLGASLLELIGEMNKVEHTRVGALNAADARQALRTLGQNFEHMIELRERLNRQTGPVLNAIIAQLDRELFKNDNMQRVTPLRVAAERLAPLCLDEQITIHLENMLAHCDNQRFDSKGEQQHAQRSLKMLAAIFAKLFSGQVDAGTLAALSHILGTPGFATGSRGRVAFRTICALVSAQVRSRRQYHDIESAIGWHDMTAGRLHRGLPHVVRHASRVGPTWRPIMHSFLLEMQLLAGIVSMESMCRLAPDYIGFVYTVLNHAAWQENTHALHAALQYVERDGRASPSEWRVVHTRHVLEALERPHPDIAIRFERAVEGAKRRGSGIAATQVVHDTSVAQILRLCGEHDQAIDRLRRLEDFCAREGRDLSKPRLSFAYHVVHYRNALELIGTQAKNPAEWALVHEAKHFFRTRIVNGYLCLRPIAAAFAL